MSPPPQPQVLLTHLGPGPTDAFTAVGIAPLLTPDVGACRALGAAYANVEALQLDLDDLGGGGE